MHSIAEPHPLQQVSDVLLVVRNAPANHAQRKRNVLPSRQVVEQTEILEHDADAPPELGPARRGNAASVTAEELHLPARRRERQEEKTQERALASAGRPRQEVKGAGPQMESDLAQNLRTAFVLKCNVVQSDHGARDFQAFVGGVWCGVLVSASMGQECGRLVQREPGVEQGPFPGGLFAVAVAPHSDDIYASSD